LVLCVWFLLVVNTSASDCLERLVPEMTYYVSRGMLNSTHSLTFHIIAAYTFMFVQINGEDVDDNYVCLPDLTRLRSQAEAVLDATYTHSRNLASFVLTYKALTLLMREIDGKVRQHHAFIAAFIGGFVIFGRYNKVNEQVRAV